MNFLGYFCFSAKITKLMYHILGFWRVRYGEFYHRYGFVLVVFVNSSIENDFCCKNETEFDVK